MSPIMAILLITATEFAPNFAYPGELTEAVAIEDEKLALEQVERMLNEKGAEILDEVAGNALYMSILKKRAKIAEILINYAVNADSDLGFSSVAIACALKTGMESILDLLMTKNVNYDDLMVSDGRTFVFAAVEHNRLSMLEKLMGKKANFEKNLLDIQEGTYPGRTALHITLNSEEYSAAMMETLLKAGAKTCVADYDGRTALDYAIMYKNEECVKVLIKYDADLSKCVTKKFPKSIRPLLEGYEVAARNGVKGEIYLEIYEKIAASFQEYSEE